MWNLGGLLKKQSTNYYENILFRERIKLHQALYHLWDFLQFIFLMPSAQTCSYDNSVFGFHL
jgi:hypothetical protein